MKNIGGGIGVIGALTTKPESAMLCRYIKGWKGQDISGVFLRINDYNGLPCWFNAANGGWFVWGEFVDESVYFHIWPVLGESGLGFEFVDAMTPFGKIGRIDGHMDTEFYMRPY
jgi:hypothetical protein